MLGEAKIIIPREYSDWENLPDALDDLISGFLDDLFN